LGRTPKKGEGKSLVYQRCLALGWIDAAELQDFDRSDALALWSFAEHALAPKLATPVDDLSIMARRRAAA
jgi:hypothetical protein